MAGIVIQVPGKGRCVLDGAHPEITVGRGAGNILVLGIGVWRIYRAVVNRREAAARRAAEAVAAAAKKKSPVKSAAAAAAARRKQAEDEEELYELAPERQEGQEEEKIDGCPLKKNGERGDAHQRADS